MHTRLSTTGDGLELACFISSSTQPAVQTYPHELMRILVTILLFYVLPGHGKGPRC